MAGRKGDKEETNSGASLKSGLVNNPEGLRPVGGHIIVLVGSVDPDPVRCFDAGGLGPF